MVYKYFINLIAAICGSPVVSALEGVLHAAKSLHPSGYLPTAQFPSYRLNQERSPRRSHGLVIDFVQSDLLLTSV